MLSHMILKITKYMNLFVIQIERTLNAVIASCFFSKDSISIGFVCRWLEQNCPRLVPPLHQFCVHTITTAYRGLLNRTDDNLMLEMATPLLENANPFDEKNPSLMPVSHAWLLVGSLPALFAKPQSVQNQNSSAMNLGSNAFKAQLLNVVPSHWTLLYDSRQHGVGSNRFLHHVLGYKGPTLCLFQAENEQIYCVASPSEWKENHLYTGQKECCLIQLQPK